MISLNAVKPGDFIKIENQPYRVVSTQHVHMGRGGAILRVKMKNLISGHILERTFKGNETLEEADISKEKVSFLYQAGKDLFFMTSNYEQISFLKEKMEEKIKFLKEGLEVEILNFENKPINIELPKKVELKVIQAPPGVKGNTVQGVMKEVTLETGLIIKAPLFIKEGDMVRVNTETGEYVERIQ